MPDAGRAPGPGVDLGPLGTSLGFLLRLSQLRNFADFFEALGPRGLRPGEVTVLDLVGRNPGIRQGVLAQALSIKRAHMTKLVGALVGAGLLARAVPPDDRRAVELTLTEAGRAHLARHAAAFHAHGAQRPASLSRGEHAQLVALLQKYLGLPESRP